jgi:ribonuclease HII
VVVLPPSRTILAREAGLYAIEQALQRRGFVHVAGADEAGRGACAGPLVVAAAILPQGRRGEIDGLNDSKLLTEKARERPDYVLTDGFRVDGIGVPALAVWKGDQVAACVSAASVLAKVTRDRLMKDLGTEWPDYGFSDHKGYSTAEHTAALAEFGPSPHHRMSYVNVAAAADAHAMTARGTVGVASSGRDAWSAPMGENGGGTDDGGRVGVR